MAEEIPPLRLFLVANNPYLAPDDPVLLDGCARADLVVSLGGIDLSTLAAALPPRKPALCVFGPKDDRRAPRQIKVLHASGFSFKGWKLAGLSGAPRLGPGSGFFLSDEESGALLQNLPAADIFFSHAYPQGLLSSDIQTIHGMAALDNYLGQRPPIYHFYAHPSANTLEERPDHLSIGVNGTFLTPQLEFV